ncbi:hypothetical protein QJS66_21670 [Kocuria rhizophila]|nr:hypothetical protein QJS66_21670 [Kocuria rhizophila]
MLRDVPEPYLMARVRLWIDRAFTISGPGTVVTGTLTAGTLRTGTGWCCGGGGAGRHRALAAEPELLRDADRAHCPGRREPARGRPGRDTPR